MKAKKTKTKRLGIRVTEAEMRILKKAAKSCDMTVSAYILAVVATRAALL